MEPVAAQHEATNHRWTSALEAVLACPACAAHPVTVDQDVHCPACGWHGAIVNGIPDFVDEARLSDSHHQEIQAQTDAVDAYYENERKLACHWDRISASEIPEMMGRPRGIALDLGCGTGSAGGGLARSGMQVIGADLSPPCLEVAARRLDGVVRADANRLPFRDNAFDALVARGALHHLADADTALKEARRVLKPGAPALFIDPREFSWLEPIKHALRREDDSFTHDHHAYTPAEYRELIEREFTVEKTWTQHPFGILVANGIDLFPTPAFTPARIIAKKLLDLDHTLNRTPLKRWGHLLSVLARNSKTA